MTLTTMTRKLYHYILQTSILVKIFIFIQISLSIWLWLIVSQTSIRKSLLIGVITLFPIPKFHLASNFLWYNKHILIDHKPVYLSSFSDKNINFINNLLDFLVRPGSEKGKGATLDGENMDNCFNSIQVCRF